MSNDTGVERTLVLFKPDAVARGLTGRILARFEDNLLKSRRGQNGLDGRRARPGATTSTLRSGSAPQVYNSMAEFMQSGPVIAIVLEGVEAVACVRKMVGSTYPDQAAPGTIRGDFAHMSQAYANAHGIAVANLVHASGNPDEAEQEIGVWFSEGGTARLSHGGAAVPSVKLWRLTAARLNQPGRAAVSRCSAAGITPRRPATRPARSFRAGPSAGQSSEGSIACRSAIE